MANNTAADMKRIMDAARKRINEMASMRAGGAGHALIENILRLVDGFQSITGNAMTGIAVGVYLDGRLRLVVTSKDIFGEDAIMRQLRKGEKYPLRQTWDGGELGKGGYAGETETSGRFASEEALRFLNSRKPRQSKGWTYIVVSAADYSKYIETTKKGNLLTATRDLLAASGAQVSDVKSGK